MTAYVVFIREEMHDPQGFSRYSEKVPASFDGHPITPLVIYGEHETLEGEEIDGAVILQFPDMEAAKNWYTSKRYQEARKQRLASSRYRVILLEGL
ncbi:DUF1330 domain-containing protein [Aureimonas fodinaquatilis]|uniref:DUF1330 domain-containing protein n=1 Tax=Aureimonas fodinaquatilis TaxID=2565783 RepID=A0A5B0DZC2_9HYPH|nr:DUF1330 domain-containing protein [Aureimonas fodinaquatilis]KAA0971101.1 DUF1330 domain-containing protein [Aureimonas fodinaquatilis]